MFPHDGVRRRWWINVESESQAFDKSRVDRLHRNDERPDWHQALRPNDGWSPTKMRLRVSIEPPNINVR
jgi:hypothetical protein